MYEYGGSDRAREPRVLRANFAVDKQIYIATRAHMAGLEGVSVCI